MTESENISGGVIVSANNYSNLFIQVESLRLTEIFYRSFVQAESVVLQ